MYLKIKQFTSSTKAFFSNTFFFSNHIKIESNKKICNRPQVIRGVFSLNGKVERFLSESGIPSYNSYIGGVYSENSKRIFLVPHSQGNETHWHSINSSTGEVIQYQHSSSAVRNAYYTHILKH
ncbi:hypothetical protein BpHYR1_004951 [Brachionus plicatilis]|uniref:Uncharacterized protein n=1 Tax=Brachionus plicatilis TaxID=10195 RepID=A0A3M7QCV8_BRAPC|nr:hypothetical protein BpHYR1_004951 [Brachionus plicatilis]